MADRMGSDPYEVGIAKPLYQTADGLKVELEGEEIWLPKKGIHDDSEVWKYPQEEGTLVVCLWLARKEGWADD